VPMKPLAPATNIFLPEFDTKFATFVRLCGVNVAGLSNASLRNFHPADEAHGPGCCARRVQQSSLNSGCQLNTNIPFRLPSDVVDLSLASVVAKVLLMRRQLALW
jgi:hypothetical protein